MCTHSRFCDGDVCGDDGVHDGERYSVHDSVHGGVHDGVLYGDRKFLWNKLTSRFTILSLVSEAQRLIQNPNI